VPFPALLSEKKVPNPCPDPFPSDSRFFLGLCGLVGLRGGVRALVPVALPLALVGDIGL
jgi:hypothetical protein